MIKHGLSICQHQNETKQKYDLNQDFPPPRFHPKANLHLLPLFLTTNLSNASTERDLLILIIPFANKDSFCGECRARLDCTLHGIRHNSADSVPTSNFVCIKMASILNSQSCDLKHGDTISNDCKIIVLSMKLQRY